MSAIGKELIMDKKTLMHACRLGLYATLSAITFWMQWTFWKLHIIFEKAETFFLTKKVDAKHDYQIARSTHEY
jgi:CII-binding regulator of phage lambda lysogenization HflD